VSLAPISSFCAAAAAHAVTASGEYTTRCDLGELYLEVGRLDDALHTLNEAVRHTSTAPRICLRLTRGTEAARGATAVRQFVAEVRAEWRHDDALKNAIRAPQRPQRRLAAEA
jgi:hypothetical protein